MRLGLLLLVPGAYGRGKCNPETRCLNSPDEGLSESSRFPPPNVSSAQLAIYEAGMEFAIKGTQRCEHGHVDLEGADLPLDEMRKCPLNRDDGSCGWVISYYHCTCVSREQALATHRTRASRRLSAHPTPSDRLF